MIDSIGKVLKLFNGEIEMTDIGKERVDTIIRSIFSGNNACSTLFNAVESGDGQYFYNAIAPTITVYEHERIMKDNTIKRYLHEIEKKRFALESILTYIDINTIPEHCRDAIREALPGRIIG